MSKLPALPYDPNCADSQKQRQELQTAIKTGHYRVLEEFANLLDKSRKTEQRLSEKEQSTLDTYLKAVQNYKPRYYTGHINAQNFARLRQQLHQAKISKNKFKYVYSRKKQQFVIYVDDYQPLPDGSAIMSGYAIPDPQQDKPIALIADIRDVKYNLAHNYQQFGSAKQVPDWLIETDAMLAELPSEIRSTFYPERETFHQADQNSFVMRMTKGMSNRPS